jgi:hypothetical protein
MTTSTSIPSEDELTNMTDGEFKIFENKLRRAADRQGYRLVKSRRRDPRAADFGGYWLIDHDNGGAVVGDQWGTDLGTIAEWLWSDPE